MSLAETCQTCGALAGRPCIKPSGKPQLVPHQQRTPEGREVLARRRKADKAAYWARLGAKP